MAKIAKCRWPGHDPFRAELVTDRGNGTFRMRALENGTHGGRQGRFIKGTEIIVLAGEIMKWEPEPEEEAAPTPAPTPDPT